MKARPLIGYVSVICSTSLLRSHNLKVATSIIFLAQSPPKNTHPSRILGGLSPPPPRSATGDVLAFYGLVNYCRDFLPGLSTVSIPLTDLTKKIAPFIWSDVHRQSFDQVKELVANAIEVTIPDPELPFVLQTDASDVGLGVTLLQPDPAGNLRPV